MKAQNIYDLADWLLKSCAAPVPLAAGNLSAAYRSVTSRAYYSALHKAIEFFDTMEIPVPKGGAKHRDIPLILKASGVPDIVELGQMLGTFSLQRNTADYQLQQRYVEDAGFAESRLRDAAKIIGRLAMCMREKGTAGTRFEQAKDPMKAEATRLAQGASSN